MNSTYYISIIQFNLDWSESMYSDPFYKKDITTFLDIMKERNSDIVILQNISKIYFEKLGREMSYLGYKKYIPDNYKDCTQSSIIFSKTAKLEEGFFLEYQKNTDHKGIFLISFPFPFEMGEEKIVIGTTVLDKLSYIKTNQLFNFDKMIHSKITKDHNIIIAIDVNSRDYEKISTMGDWKDAWYESGTDKEKYTLDFMENGRTPNSFLDRPDRVWFLEGTSSKKIDCIHFELIGKRDKIISSHYGIFSIFSYGG